MSSFQTYLSGLLEETPPYLQDTLERKHITEQWVNARKEEGHMLPMVADLSIRMFSILERLYPGRWDMEVKWVNFCTEQPDGEDEYTDSLMLFPVILFPEFEIESFSEDVDKDNVCAWSHTVKDVYVRLEIYPVTDNEGYTDMDCSGFSLKRGTLSAVEFLHGYIHSHVNRAHGILRHQTKVGIPYERQKVYKDIATGLTGAFEYSFFCTGISELNDICCQFIDNYNSDEYIELFLLTIEQAIKGESVDGGPYIYYKELAEKEDYLSDGSGFRYYHTGTITFPGSLFETYTEHLFKKWKNSITENNFSGIDIDNELHVVDNERLEEAIKLYKTVSGYHTGNAAVQFNNCAHLIPMVMKSSSVGPPEPHHVIPVGDISECTNYFGSDTVIFPSSSEVLFSGEYINDQILKMISAQHIFRGDYLTLTIERDDLCCNVAREEYLSRDSSNTLDKMNFIVHPKIKQHVINKIENRLKEIEYSRQAFEKAF